MGKSPNSCFKIIFCGADSTDIDDDLSPPESKQSSDKRKWSFRKRSARHQVPSNTVISEPQLVGFDKQNSEATTAKFYSVKDSSVPEKTLVGEQENVTAPLSSGDVNSEDPSVERTSETAPLSSAVINSEGPPVTEQANETATSFLPVVKSEVTPDTGKITTDVDPITTDVDPNLQEKVAVVIQAAARRFLAQRKLQKLKNIVKLQAVVRGHHVRKEAIGTLRCVQAIAKMQVLVRARRARQCKLLEKCTGQEENDEEFQIDLVKRNSDLKSNRTNSTVEKLLCNGFARQLLESTSKTKPIHISCDPSMHDSAWQWLERWMAVTSSKVGQQEEHNCTHGYKGEQENSTAAYEELDVIPVVGASMLSASKLPPTESTAAEDEGDSKADNFVKLESQAPAIVSVPCFGSSAEGDKEHTQGEEDIGMEGENCRQAVSGKESSDADSQSTHANYPNYTDSVTQNLKNTTKTAASDPVETEDKKFDLGSRKIRNPVFAAVQAKFEELSSAPKAGRSVNVSRDATVESKPNHSSVVSVTKRKDLSSTENSITQNLIIRGGASECGTEISISSTLDSSDRSETDGGEIVLEIGTSVERNHNVSNGAGEAFNLENMKDEEKILPTASNEYKGERPRDDEENMANSIAAVDSVKVEGQPVEAITPGIWNQQENLKAQAYRSSPEGSPRNYVTAPESHGTPSSQVSTQSKTSKSQNNIPARRPKKSKSGTKNSPSNVKNDSAEKSSTEHLPKDAKNANRRSSFGMSKLDHADNEPSRSSSNSLPSYMQATESARAKAHGSLSLKSSPDLQDKDNNMKKRHSLPIVDEKQDSSPRVQRSTSQTQQSSKRNSNHSPHNSAERRWQR